MDRYVAITTINDHCLANDICAALEGKNIPVLVEHIQLSDEDYEAGGFRVFVPQHFSQASLEVLSGLIGKKRARKAQNLAA